MLAELADGLFGGDLAMGANGASTVSLIAFLWGFQLLQTFSQDLSLHYVSAFQYFNLFLRASPGLSFGLGFVPVFILGPLPIKVSNSTTTGTSFLFVMPSGVSLLFI